MISNQLPIPENEMERLMALSEFDIDYTNLAENFQDLIHLAAKVAGTEISLINLIDTYTQWSVARYGLEIDQMPREDSVCQYTIMEDDHFEVQDLSADARFTNKNYVKNPLNLRYYFGIPLRTNDGQNLGALCVLDPNDKKLSPEKVELLKLIAKEVVNRLNTIKAIEDLKHKLSEIKETNKRVAHDIRGPIAGIIGISQIIAEQGESNQLDEVLDFVNLIHKSSKSVLDLADEILSEEKNKKPGLRSDDFNLELFKEKLEKLYGVQASQKGLALIFSVNPEDIHIPFAKNKLLQIVGNLIANAIKFTPSNGTVTVDMGLKLGDNQLILTISVSDTGAGMSKETINGILNGTENTTKGTCGEVGYGFGLSMVRHLIKSLKGTLTITSALDKGSRFEVLLPQN